MRNIYEICPDLFKVFADVVSRNPDSITRLFASRRCVSCDIAEPLDMTQSRPISASAFRTLKQAKLVRSNGRQKSVFYSLEI